MRRASSAHSASSSSEQQRCEALELQCFLRPRVWHRSVYLCSLRERSIHVCSLASQLVDTSDSFVCVSVTSSLVESSRPQTPLVFFGPFSSCSHLLRLVRLRRDCAAARRLRVSRETLRPPFCRTHHRCRRSCLVFTALLPLEVSSTSVGAHDRTRSPLMRSTRSQVLYTHKLYISLP